MGNLPGNPVKGEESELRSVASAIICPGLLEIQPFGVRNVCGTGNVRVFKRVLAPRAPFYLWYLRLEKFWWARPLFWFENFWWVRPLFWLFFFILVGVPSLGWKKINVP